jgi:hypothetical protein
LFHESRNFQEGFMADEAHDEADRVAKEKAAPDPRAGRFEVTHLAFKVDSETGILKVDCREPQFKDEAEVKCGQNTAKAFDLTLPAAKSDLDELKQALRAAIAAMGG